MDSPLSQSPGVTHALVSPPGQPNRLTAGISVLLVLLLYSAVQVPVPGVNEPHYLCMARSYWQPDWCARDFFLQSYDAHRVFYQTFGPATLVLPFPAAAWLGRVLALTCLAVGWTAVVRTVNRDWRVPAVAAAVYLLVSTWLTYSGEWVVGGVESKVVAYGCALWAVAACCHGWFRRASAAAGLAISFHPVVGLWFLLAGVAAGVAHLLTKPAEFRIPPRRRMLSSIAWLTVCAAPGLIPALALVVDRSTPADVRLDATYIQVFHRLAHHLDPLRFPVHRHVIYGVTGLLWTAVWMRAMTGSRATDDRVCRRWLMGLVAASGVFALVGVLVGLGPRPALEMPGFAWRATLLKFYPFRLFDAALPAGVAIVLATGVCRANSQSGVAASGWRRYVPWAVFLLTVGLAVGLPARSRNPIRMPPERWQDWQSVCAWIETHTAADCLVLTPRDGFGFKWFAERAEYFSPKDCPQDAAGIVEWFRRATLVRKFEAQGRANPVYARDDLQQWRVRSDVTHVVLPASRSVTGLQPVHQNDHFHVYELP